MFMWYKDKLAVERSDETLFLSPVAVFTWINFQNKIVFVYFEFALHYWDTSVILLKDSTNSGQQNIEELHEVYTEANKNTVPSFGGRWSVWWI